MVLDQPKIFLWILFFIFYYHHLFAWYCIHLIIIRRDSVLVTFFLFFSFSLFFFPFTSTTNESFLIHARLVSNICPTCIKYMPDWYQIHAAWYQIHARLVSNTCCLVSNTCPIGIKYMPDWYQKKLTKKQRGQERKNCFVRASHKL